MGLGVLAMNPLAGGEIPKHADQLTFLANENETPTEAALRFCISCPDITITLNGFTTKEQIDMACRVADNCHPFALAQIEKIKNNINENMNRLCTSCLYCLKTDQEPADQNTAACPQNIPIVTYMQLYNEKMLFNKTAREMIDDMDRQHKWGILVARPAQAGDCTQCGQCQEKCTQHLNIIERLTEIAKWEKKAKNPSA